MREIPGITPLRAFAAGLVLLSHVAFWTGGSNVDGGGRLLARGDSGVAVFFAVTGFLLLRPAVREDARWPPRRYAVKRFTRIAPAYWLALCAVLLISTGTAAGTGGPLKVIEHVLLLQGFTQDTYQGFTQTWSLTTEASFYLLVPALGRVIRRFQGSRSGLIGGLLAVALLSVVIQAWSASRSAPAFGALSTSVLGHATWFVTGVIVLLARENVLGQEKTGRSRFAVIQMLTPASCLAGAATCYVLAATPIAGPLDLTHLTLFTAGVKELLYAIIAGLLLTAATSPLVGKPAAVVKSDVAQLAGDVSYGIFLWHVLVIQALFLVVGLPLFHAPFLLVLIPTVVVSGALAWLSWTFLERPAIAWAHRRTREQRL